MQIFTSVCRLLAECPSETGDLDLALDAFTSYCTTASTLSVPPLFHTTKIRADWISSLPNI